MTIQISDFEDIKKLLKLIQKSQVDEFELTDSQGVQIRIVQRSPATSAPQPLTFTPASAPLSAPEPQPEPPKAPSTPAEQGHAINSPMVGTVYLTPSPDEPPFVKVGDRVRAGDTLCLIEAMKMFNKIKADKGGVIKSCCVEAGQPVEFGQTLFLIED